MAHFVRPKTVPNHLKVAAEFRTKNHQGGLSRSSENACLDGQIMDPRQVRLVKFLLRKLHPDCQFLYMKPRADSKWTSSEDVWYTLVNLGHNPISLATAVRSPFAVKTIHRPLRSRHGNAELVQRLHPKPSHHDDHWSSSRVVVAVVQWAIFT